MSMNDTPAGERIHIGVFGRRNAGKSSMVNAITAQELAIVSEVKGTTTDPVYKAMELLPLGPVMLVDTAGLDDDSALGEKRIEKTRQVLRRIDIALLIVDANEGLLAVDRDLIAELEARRLPYLIVYNKKDLLDGTRALGPNELLVSAHTREGIFELKERIAHLLHTDGAERRLVGDLLQPGDTVVMVVPIDSAAPKGRLILPQQQVLRDILDADAVAVVAKEDTLQQTLDNQKQPPRLVITDSQAFAQVARIVPPEVPLTSFSILMARYKGFLRTAVDGVHALDRLRDGDTVLICEGCTHHRQCDDIGTVKLPRWIGAYTGKKLQFSFTSGAEYATAADHYQLVLHCGGCMLKENELRFRMETARAAGVPFANYGTAIAHMNGILARTLAPVAGTF